MKNRETEGKMGTSNLDSKTSANDKSFKDHNDNLATPASFDQKKHQTDELGERGGSPKRGEEGRTGESAGFDAGRNPASSRNTGDQKVGNNLKESGK